MEKKRTATREFTVVYKKKRKTERRIEPANLAYSSRPEMQRTGIRRAVG